MCILCCIYCRRQFVSDHLLFYTVLFHSFLERALRMELSSYKNAHMLFRVSKVCLIIIHFRVRNILVEGQDYKQGGIGKDRHEDMGNIRRRRRLCWKGHMVRMEGERQAIQAMDRNLEGKRQTTKELAGN